MNIVCPRCRERPRPTRRSMYCRPCERAYRAERRFETCAKHKRYRERNKDRIARQREDRIQWWMSLEGDALENIKRHYRETRRDLTRTYRDAMGRLEKTRRDAELAHLEPLPRGLARAAKAWRKANLAGSRPQDSVRVREWA